MSGKWFVSGTSTYLGNTDTYSDRHWEVTQSGADLTVTGEGTDPLYGTIDGMTGQFQIDVPSNNPFHPEAGGTIAGSVAADGKTFTATADLVSCSVTYCITSNVTYDGTRCGNGDVDAGELCDDGNVDAGDCCSPTCTTDPAGTACTSDDNTCTDDLCDGAGSCEHDFNSAPCVDGSGCSTGTCSAGACVASSPLASGTSCDLDANGCTMDACDGAGTCTAGGPLDCTPCGVCNSELGCVAPDDALSACDTNPYAISLKIKAGGGQRNSFGVSFDEFLQTAHMGDPSTDTSYTFCVYAQNNFGYRPVILSASIPAAGLCGDKPCWSQRNDENTDLTFAYKNSDRTADGIKTMRISRFHGIRIRGGGEYLRLATELPLDYSGLTPLVIADGAERHCWSHFVLPQKYSSKYFKGEYEPTP